MSTLATTDQNVAVGKRLVAVRTAAGLTQSSFAESLGLSPRAYANYERGEREIPMTVLRALYEIHGIDPIWLMTGPEFDPAYALERRLDLELMEELIRIIETNLHRVRKILKPAKKARLIRLAYERCMRAGKIDTAQVRDMISLAA